MIREALSITALGLGVVIVVTGICFTPYVIGTVLIGIFGEIDQRGYGARWAMGCFTLLLLGASYFIGKQFWS